jgi:hypothetical protein
MRAALGLAVVLLTGCGSSSPAAPPAPPTHATAPPARAALPPTLAAAAVAYLPSAPKPLTAASLTREAQAPSLAARLRAWGFQAGADRYFQGESRRLQVVDSRTLRFRAAAGAASFVAFMRTHLSAFLGSFPRIARFAVGARRGFLATGEECQCHLANPSFLAMVSRGVTVTWLEINGPGATRRGLAALIARAP